MPLATATPTVESPTCPCGQETPDTAAHGDGRRVNLPGWPTVLLALLYPVSRLLLEALVDRHHPDADLRLELLVLCHQLRVLQRQGKRPCWRPADRLLLAGLSLARTGSASSSAPRPWCAGIAIFPAQVGPVRPPPQARTPRSGRDPALVSLTPQAVMQHAPARPAPTGPDE
jgi:hypothetical protein